MSLLFPRHSARRGIFTGKFSPAPVSLHPPYSVPVSGHLPYPPPAPSSPSLRKPPSAGALTTLVFLYGRISPPPDRPAPSLTRAIPHAHPYKTHRKNTSRAPFSMPKPPPPRHRFKKFKIKRQNMKIELTFSKDSVIIKEKEAGCVLRARQPCIRKCGSTPSYNRITGTLWTV